VKSSAARSPLPSADVALTDDAKEDAASQRVTRSRSFKVGEKVTGELTRNRGWIAHPVELLGGQEVVVTLAGRTPAGRLGARPTGLAGRLFVHAGGHEGPAIGLVAQSRCDLGEAGCPGASGRKFW